MATSEAVRQKKDSEMSGFLKLSGFYSDIGTLRQRIYYAPLKAASGAKETLRN